MICSPLGMYIVVDTTEQSSPCDRHCTRCTLHHRNFSFSRQCPWKTTITGAVQHMSGRQLFSLIDHYVHTKRGTYHQQRSTATLAISSSKTDREDERYDRKNTWIVLKHYRTTNTSILFFAIKRQKKSSDATSLRMSHRILFFVLFFH